MTKRATIWVAAIVGAAAVLAGLVVASGMRFYTVMTPSMGQVAPVGTLVVTRPAESYVVGDIVTYERKDRSYTHRIVTANADGTFITKGDLNGAPDALPVAQSQIVGRVVWIGPGLGWLWQALPWLALGGLVVYAVSLLRRFDRTWRWVLRFSGWTLVFCLVAFWLRPWVSLSQLNWTPSGSGVDMHVVNTGLFPLDVLGNRLVSGQDAVVHVVEQNAAGYYTLTPGLAFHWWEQVGLFLLCLIPFALSFLIRDDKALTPARVLAESGDADEAAPAAIPAEPAAAPSAHKGPNRRRLILTGAVTLAIITSVAVVTFSATASALTAKIQNTTDTAGSRTFFSCTNAVTSTGSSSSPASPFLAWAMGTSGTRSASDLTAHGRSGTFAATTTTNTSTSTVGCNRDTPKSSVYFNGTSQCLYTASTVTGPQTYSLEAWFWTSTKPNGKIIGFGNAQNGTDSTYDRHIYVDNVGRVLFGTYNDGFQVVASPSGTSYADSKWHNVIATQSPSTGMKLYIDGDLVASNSSYTAAENTNGYWKAGCGNLGGSWPNAAGSASWGALNYFKGQIQYAAVYSSVLTATQAEEHFQAGQS
jgi:signal peptidase I